jgi:hypothetical protein
MDRKNSSAVQALKSQAKGLRKHLADKGVEFTHSQALEAVAHSHGHKDWNTAVAEADMDDAVQEAEDLLDDIVVGLLDHATKEIKGLREERRLQSFRLEHLVQPSGTRLAFKRVRKRVDQVIADGGSVCYVDFVMELVPEEWKEHLNNDRFIVAQPSHFQEASKIIHTMCAAGVDLVVLAHPRACLPADGTGDNLDGRFEQSTREWNDFLLKLRHETQGSTVLAFNSFRVKEAPMSAYNGFSPWTQLSEQEWVLDPDRKRDEDTKNRYLSEMKCPSCSGPLERKPGMFASSKTGHMDGLVCESCNALWDDPGNSFLKAHAKATKEQFPHTYTATVVKKPNGHRPLRGVNWRVEVLVTHPATGGKASDYFEGFYTDVQIEKKAQEMAEEVARTLAAAHRLPRPQHVEVADWVYPEDAGPKIVIVNGREERWDLDEITYEELVKRAFKVEKAREGLTAVWSGVSGSGTLYPGSGRVAVETGTVFNVTDTSNA